MEKLQTEELKRELGIFDVAINVVNISISSGIFILPALIAAILRGASIMAYILCGLMLLLIALCYAEVGSPSQHQAERTSISKKHLALI